MVNAESYLHGGHLVRNTQTRQWSSGILLQCPLQIVLVVSLPGSAHRECVKLSEVLGNEQPVL